MAGHDQEGGVGVHDIDARVERLLNQLENPNLSDSEIDRIEKKIKLLRELES